MSLSLAVFGCGVWVRWRCRACMRMPCITTHCDAKKLVHVDSCALRMQRGTIDQGGFLKVASSSWLFPMLGWLVPFKILWLRSSSPIILPRIHSDCCRRHSLVLPESLQDIKFGLGVHKKLSLLLVTPEKKQIEFKFKTIRRLQL